MIPWSHSPPDDHHNAALAFITQMAHMDRDLGVAAAQMEWVIDGVTYHEKVTLMYLARLSERDLALAKDVITWPWVINKEGIDKSLAVEYFVTIVEYGPDISQFFVPVAKPHDEITQFIKDFFSAVSLLVSADEDFTITVLQLPWVKDGIQPWKTNAVRTLATLVEVDSSLARSVIQLPWFVDGFSSIRAGVTYSLTRIAQRNLELGRELFHSTDVSMVTKNQSKERFWSIALHRLHPDELFDHLIEQPWFVDGLDAEETAFVGSLFGIIQESRRGDSFLETYKSFFESRYTQSSSIDLPLSGETDIWIFKNTPFYPNQDFVKLATEIAQAAEEVLSIPFPTTDIMYLLIEAVDTQFGHPTYFAGNTAVIGIHGDDVPVYLMYHELGHLYFSGWNYFEWIREGVPEFLSKYASVRAGRISWSEMRENTALNARYCMDEIATNLRELVVHQRQLSEGKSSCNYSFGSYFFIRLYELLGAERFAASMAEIERIRTDPEAGRALFESIAADTQNHRKIVDSYVENTFYQSFLKNTPPELLGEFEELYERLHGPVGDDAGT